MAAMPWRGYRHEWLVLVLVAFASLGYVFANTQDQERFALTQVVYDDGTLVIDRFIIRNFEDKAFYDGHYYALHAPGLSFAAIPALAVVDAAGGVDATERRDGVWETPWLAWVLRTTTSGALFLLGVFVLGRVAEGLAGGTGAATAVTFALGTLAVQLAATTFGHVAAGALAFAGFVCAWAGVERERDALVAVGGLAAGLAVLVEYQAALVAMALVVYVLLKTRRVRSLLALAVGALPAVLALGAYQWAAFGSPFSAAYRHSANSYADQQAEDFYGIGAPDPDNIYRILVTRHGVLATTPVLLAGAVGLWLLWRGGRRAEALFCGAVTLLFFFLNAGYFEVYGGASPGPRFLVLAFPFLAVGLAPAFSRRPLVTGALALFSIAAMTIDASTSTFSLTGLGNVVFTETVWSVAGAPRALGLAVGWVAAAGAAFLAARNLLGLRREPAGAIPGVIRAGPA
jgi:hypothetical protein